MNKAKHLNSFKVARNSNPTKINNVNIYYLVWLGNTNIGLVKGFEINQRYYGKGDFT